MGKIEKILIAITLAGLTASTETGCASFLIPQSQLQNASPSITIYQGLLADSEPISPEKNGRRSYELDILVEGKSQKKFIVNDINEKLIIGRNYTLECSENGEVINFYRTNRGMQDSN